ncbi:MAG: AAA family ATPase [Planctomycetota bacterium]
MKIAVSGKGGVGKTTFVAILARILAEEGRIAIAIDADPDANLASALGVPADANLTPIGQMRDLIAERTGASPEGYGKFFKMNPSVSDLPEKFSVEQAGVRLMVLGGVYRGGGGCACPENVFLKALLTHLILHRNEDVLVDMEAGIEHLGRATVQAVDALLVVVEPGRRSVQTAHEVRSLGADLGIKRIAAVGNKVQEPAHLEFMRTELDDVPLLGAMSYSENLIRADLAGQPSYESDPKIVKEVRIIRENLGEFLDTEA